MIDFPPSPWDALPNNAPLLLDIRPHSERHSGDIGFIPGSVHAPLQEDHTLDTSRCDDLIQAAPSVTLVCLSGHRSERALAVTPTLHDRPVSILRGGLLAWGAKKLPLAGRGDPFSPPPFTLTRLDQLFGVFRSCFIAEMVETLMQRAEDDENAPDMADLDLIGMLRWCFVSAHTSTTHPDRSAIPHVIDRASLLSLRAGTPMPRVRENIDAMLNAIAAASSAHASAG